MKIEKRPHANLFSKIQPQQFIESYQGWQAYAKWANTYRLRNKFFINTKK